jgi:hypothetical protein
MRSFLENQHSSKPFQTFQTKPPESYTISNDAAPTNTSGTAPVIHSVDDDEDSEATPPPPPPKFVSLVGQNILNLEPSPEADQNKPPSPPPNADQIKPSSENPKSPEPEQQINPNSEVIQKINSPVNDIEKSPHHVAMDNSCDLSTPIKKHVQQIDETLNLEILPKKPLLTNQIT